MVFLQKILLVIFYLVYILQVTRFSREITQKYTDLCLAQFDKVLFFWFTYQKAKSRFVADAKKREQLA